MLKNLPNLLIEKHFQANENLPTSPGSDSVAVVRDLTWDCSREFDATSADAVSFVEDDGKASFVSFPNWISRTGAMVSFKVSFFYFVSDRMKGTTVLEIV